MNQTTDAAKALGATPLGIITAPQLAQMLGVHVRTIRRMVQRGLIPNPARRGRSRVWDIDVIRRALTGDDE